MDEMIRQMYYDEFMESVNSYKSLKSDENEFYSSEFLGIVVPIPKLYERLKDGFDDVSEIESLSNEAEIELDDYYGCPGLSYYGIMEIINEKYGSLLDKGLPFENEKRIANQIETLKRTARRVFSEQKEFDKWIEVESEKLK
jgi:hypothetical protein